MAETASPRPDALLRSLLLEKREAIAVIGMSIRFPGDNNTPRGEFSAFLGEGCSGTGPVPSGIPSDSPDACAVKMNHLA
ncbi:hypothetical protein ACVWZD_004078 [Streptomyces sp. TE3672]